MTDPKDIKFLSLDVDGVMTDGFMYYSESGEEIKRFSTKDGRGIIELQKAGVQVGLISSGRKLNIIEGRAKTLGIERYHVGTGPKKDVLEKWCAEMGITPAQCAHIGDDINDREILQAVGISACPADAVPSIREMVDIVLQYNGGQGAIREFIEEHLGYRF